MKLQFYSKGNRLSDQKAVWAKIFFEGVADWSDWNNEYGDGVNKFERTDEIAGTVPIFISQAVGECEKELTLNRKEDFTRLFEKNAPDAILVCRLDFFKEAVWLSNEADMDPNIMVVGVERTILYYAFIGEDRCALLIAYETCDDRDD